ncbi:MAG: uracil-DNA glycosylase [bacterium]|nr:uracil-DNA glycosylase [bacterium]MDD4558618.1 uracil-DNA glycosylase [bacterium]
MSRARVLEEIRQEILVCPRCDLCKSRTNAVPGAGSLNANIFFIGEAPGQQEDLKGEPFVGTAGKLLDSLLEMIGIKREEVFITNVVKCRPPGNRDPRPDEISSCNPYLVSQIALIEPIFICTLGRFAMQTVIDPEMSITRDHGIPVRRSGVIYFPMYHPAAALYRGELKQMMKEDMLRLKALIDSEKEK